MVSSETNEGLRNCELFALLNEEEIKALSNSLVGVSEIKAYEAGDYIFEQGEYTARLYIIMDGQVLLQRSVNINIKDRTAVWPLGLLGKGRVMGWSALLYGPRHVSASAICQKPTRVIAIEGAALWLELEKAPALGLKIMDRLACVLGERLRAAYNTMEAHL